jgi:hypothetical protein
LELAAVLILMALGACVRNWRLAVAELAHRLARLLCDLTRPAVKEIVRFSISSASWAMLTLFSRGPNAMISVIRHDNRRPWLLFNSADGINFQYAAGSE